MSELKLIGGKFMRDGIEVPVTIGDREQIELLRKMEKLATTAKTTGIECRFCKQAYTINGKLNAVTK